jgi:predicted regulator of Ras-like GTPase activity (Roadblock/LC7/MglB family)
VSKALDMITRVRGVRGAMLVTADDGLVVAEQLMEGIKGGAVAALAASLAGRLRRAMEAAGTGGSVFWHLQAEQGALLVVPAGNVPANGEGGGILVVAVAEPDVNIGLVRLELLRAAEAAV